ncbi:YbaB/EbfC family nucleoid-associated protein [Actinosynnema sp. NPDC053489]|uniref:YbaB/EbfC family nucleoid-associated protein n=1 Tax=Actinosynnema sp. NPDC053489 TaxID=3363916 RepID=UPI0037CB5EF4
MNPERMIADLEAEAGNLAERYRELRERLRRAQATRRSPDGVVTATVGPNGSLRHIEFSPEAGGLPPARLGEVVLDTVRRAQEEAARQAAAVVGPRFRGTAAMDFLTAAVPPPPPVPEDRSVPDDRSATGDRSAPDGPPAHDDVPLPRSLWAPDDPGAASR